jgi:hypothetical protein
MKLHPHRIVTGRGGAREGLIVILTMYYREIAT